MRWSSPWRTPAAASARGAHARAAQGVGLPNMRERLAALYGPRGRFTLRARRRRAARARPLGTARSSPPDRAALTTALIAEDEPMLRAQLKARLAEAWPELALVGEAENGGEALALIEAHAPGHRVPRHPHAGAERASTWRAPSAAARTSCSSPPTTNTRSQAFEEGAVDYVLKPVTAERLAKVVARLQGAARRRRRSTWPRCWRAWPARARRRPLRWIRASLGNTMQMIAVDDVLYFQAEDKYTKVVTADERGADQEADQGALRRARPGGVLADPSRDDREPPRHREGRARLARPAGDHAARSPREAHRLAHVRGRFKTM